MLSPINISSSCVFRQSFNSVSEVLNQKPTVTGTLNVLEGEYRSLSQNQKLTYTDTSIGNFDTLPFSVRIITKINSYTTLGSTYNTLISKGTSGTNGFSIAITPTNLVFIILARVTTVAYTLTNKYIDIIATRSGNNTVLYINGVSIATDNNGNNAVSVSTGNLQISGDLSIIRYIKQSVKLVELYNKALTASEVISIYNNSKFKNYNSIMDITKWLKGTATFSETYQTTYNSIISLGQKIFTCNVAGLMSYPSNWIYGTIEFSMYKLSDASQTLFNFTSTDNIASTGSGYRIKFTTTESITLGRAGGTEIMVTANSYMVIATWYRIRITRTLTGVFTCYIKGGIYTNWTIISVVGGSGSNPVTDNTYITSNYCVLNFAIGDQISDIRFYSNTLI